MNGYKLAHVEGMQSLHHGAVKLAGAELGVESFGIQLLEFPAGFDAYPEHDHAEDGQEEVYLIMAGAAEFSVDGERVPVQTGDMIRVEAGSRRTLRPGAAGVRILAIGAVPGGTYERPEGFRLAVGS
jgi:uncharacterized cupin superfamily protein